MALKSFCGLKEQVLVCAVFRPFSSYHLVSLVSPHLTPCRLIFLSSMPRKQALNPVTVPHAQRSDLSGRVSGRGNIWALTVHNAHAYTHCQDLNFQPGFQKPTSCVSTARCLFAEQFLQPEILHTDSQHKCFHMGSKFRKKSLNDLKKGSLHFGVRL